VEVEAGVVRQPGLDLGVFVGPVVVQDQVQLTSRVATCHQLEET
jgi:hypothetical protein